MPRKLPFVVIKQPKAIEYSLASIQGRDVSNRPIVTGDIAHENSKESVVKPQLFTQRGENHNGKL